MRSGCLELLWGLYSRERGLFQSEEMVMDQYMMMKYIMRMWWGEGVMVGGICGKI